MSGLDILTAAGWGLVLCLGLHLTLGRRALAWLVACFAASFVYVVLSLQLEQVGAGWWLAGLRWGLFATAVFAFVRYRMVRSRS